MKKREIYFWGLLLLAFTASGLAQAKDNKGESVHTMHVLKRIVIDPGHGGTNEGCMGPAKVLEKVVTLQVSLAMEKALQEQTDSSVILTRREDVELGLRERTRFANAQQGDLFISVHMNASPSGRGVGIETFLLSSTASDEETRLLVEREQKDVPVSAPLEEARQGELDSVLFDMKLRAAHTLSEDFAAFLQKELIRVTGAVDRGIKQAPFGVLKEAQMPAVVLECGFLTHPKEGERLLDPEYQMKLAHAVAQAVIAFDRNLKKNQD